MKWALLILCFASPAAFSVDKATALAAARKAGEPELTKVYVKWARLYSTPELPFPKREEPWLAEEPVTTEDAAASRWTFVWEHHPPSGWIFTAHITVDKTGKASILKSDAYFATQR